SALPPRASRAVAVRAPRARVRRRDGALRRGARRGGCAMRSSRFLVLAALAAAALARASRAQTVEPGYGFDSVQVAPGGAFVGGFEILGNGDYAVFDGTSVVEESPLDGSLIRTLFTPSQSVFGAFLTLSPDGATLYFGESTYGKIYAVDVVNGGG